ncbi:MAG: cytochrome C [Rudaea sp.]
MFRSASIVLAAALTCLGSSARADAANIASQEPPKRLGLCAACHGEHGVANEHSVPNLAGQNLEYMKSAVQQYQKGQRDFAAMRAAMGMLSPVEVDRILTWYAAQAPAQPSR